MLSAEADTARGRYVFLLADCSGCHSVHDYSRLGGPVMPGYTGIGQVMPAELGLPGKIVAPNITPDKETGIGSWTGAEIIRAIRNGIGRDGRTLFPFMPYPYYNAMSDSDVSALVAYLRTLTPRKNQLPRTELPPGFPLPPSPPARSVPHPARANRVKFGEYLVTVAACADCHTPMGADHAPDQSKRFSGGFAIHLPGGLSVVSANITPDPETGIGKWTEKQFVARFLAYKRYATDEPPPPVGKDQFTIMPWLSFSQLTPEDLGAMYAYLRTVPAVKNSVRTHPPAVTAKR